MGQADLREQFSQLLAVDPLSLDGERLLAESAGFETLRSMLEAASMAYLAAIESRGLLKDRRVRNTARWLTHETRVASHVAGKRVRVAGVLRNQLPSVWEALAAGRITLGHAEVLSRLVDHPGLIEALLRDIETLVGWAEREPWPLFRGFVDAWSEIVDTTDPADLDDKQFDRRSLAYTNGVGGAVLVQLDTTSFCWEQVMTVTRPVYEQLLEQDWAAAKAEYGENARPAQLVRTDSQRWHDALMQVIRAGAGGSDPGASVEVVVVVDLPTLEREAQRQAAEAGVAAPPEPRSKFDAENYRCHTLSGLRLTPSTALLATLAGRIRRVTLQAASLDLEVSVSARLFKGPLRTALMVRDRFCTEPGCHTPAHRCQADHILPYHEGGPTSPTNGAMLCPAGHRHKTRLEALGLWRGT